MKKENSSEKNNLILEKVIALLPGHIYWLSKDGKYIGCNDQQAKSAGLKSRDEIVGLRNKDLPWNLHGKEIVEKLEAVNRKVMESNCSISTEEPGTLIDGTEVTFLSEKHPLKDENNNVIGMLGVSVDITNIKKLERDLSCQIEETKKANLANIAFINMASHEIKGPLGNVSGILQTIKYDAENIHEKLYGKILEALNGSGESNLLKEISDLHNHNIKNIEQAISSAKITVDSLNNLISLSYIQSSEMEVKISPAKVDDMIDELIKECNSDNKVKFIKKTTIKTKDNIYFDYNNCYDAIKVFIKNSIRFSFENNVVTVSYDIKNEADKSFLEIKIQDFGKGIHEEQINFLFDLHLNIEDESKTRIFSKPSTQLIIAKKKIESSGGNINITSKIDEGTTITAKIPCKISSESLYKSISLYPERKQVDFFDKKIFVVEDDDRTRDLVIMFLKELGYNNVEFSSSGKKAIKKVVENDYDIVLLDITLEDINGIEVNKRIREELKLKVKKSPFFIAITSHSSDVNDDVFLRSGFDVVLGKPLIKKDLKNAIEEILESTFSDD